MIAERLIKRAESYLQRLCVDIASRRVGSEGNRAATDFFAGVVSSFGFETECPAFDCIDWSQAGVEVMVDGTPFAALASPYSLGCHVSAPLIVVATVEALAATDLGNQIVLLRGDITREQLMPKNFPFYNPDHHKRIIQLLEEKQPRAIITATSRDAEMVGGAVYPFPLIEDGDFDVPSVYMTSEEGDRLAQYAGQELWLESRAQRISTKGCNVTARKGANPRRRVVLFAHIDAKMGTPGAVDNASGVIVMLLLAELLAEYSGNLGIEIVALNGEDYYSNPGEQQYLALNEGSFDEIALGVNVDGVGYYKGSVAYSLYDCPPDLARLIHQLLARYEDVSQGDPWYQGDHGLFLMKQRPALALTSERVTELMTEIVHTPKDSPDLIDTRKLATVAVALRELLFHLEQDM